ncbi:hypothetical protein [Mycolicibacterium sp.]|uniref:hypothetical protein n=1 Tax=Mycolicibacterium sp. TaxID=2320850 RepID=UPI0037CC1EE6
MDIRRSLLALSVAIMLLTLVGCSTGVPDRRADAEALAGRIRALPGVVAATSNSAHSQAQGLIYVRIGVEVTDDITAEQVADITTRYLHGIATGTFTGYQLELDVRRGWNVFAVDSGRLPIINSGQVIAQARDWATLRSQFASATVTLRATIEHPAGQKTEREVGHSNLATLVFDDHADYRAVSAAVGTLSQRFPQLGGLDWTIDAGKDKPAEIKTSRRLPTAAELAVFDRLNADQAIPHIVRLRINGPVTPPVWFSEKTIGSRDVEVALQLARAHLPLVATLPAPVLYTASDHLSGHIGGSGFARGPVAITVGGCTKHDPLVYVPIAAERQLITEYEKCPL